MNPVATSTEVRASRALRTVKKRMSMCGSPAVPKIRASPSDIADIGSLTRPPGAMIAAKTDQRRFHAIDNPSAFTDQAFALAAWAPGVFFLKRWDRDHSAVTGFTTQPS